MRSEDFRRIWLPMSGQFYRMAFYMLENEPDAKDAVQDLYVKLWNSKDRISDILNPMAYGMRILKNLCIDRIRKASGCGQDLPESIEDRAVAEGQDPENVLIGRESLDMVRKYIGRLPEKQRQVLEMRILQDMEYSDMAKATGMSELNLRVNMSLARKSLKKMMEEEI